MTDKTLRDKIEENLAELDKDTRQALIYIRGNLNEIEAYSTLMRNISEYVSDQTRPADLQSRLVEASRIFTVQSEAAQPEAPTQKQRAKWLTYAKAIEYWKQEDIRAGRTPVTSHGYEYRIKSLARGQQIQVKKAGRFIREVEYHGLDAAIDSFRYRTSRSIVIPAQQDKQKDELQYWITARGALDLYRRIETEAPHINNAETSERAYQTRIRRMIAKGLKIKGQGRDLRFYKPDLLERIRKRLNGNTRQETPYREFVRLIEQEKLSQDEALNRLNIEGKRRGSLKGVYIKNKKRESSKRTE